MEFDDDNSFIEEDYYACLNISKEVSEIHSPFNMYETFILFAIYILKSQY